ncbi:MAG: anti-sigma factor [Acidimicrobiia bacterium]|nr:anti-sigma factor [Acidimicrobiia bacterium]
MTHDELQSLLGAYALDAVEPDEAAMLDAHLADCPRCRAEVAAHRATAATLANVGGEAPAEVWDRIAATLDFEGAPAGAQALPAEVVLPSAVAALRSRRPLSLPVLAGLAAAAAVVIGLLGVSTVRLQHRVDHLRDAVSAGGLEQAAAGAALDPRHTTTALRSPDGALSAQVVIGPDGAAYLINSGLRPLDPSRTYQLWGLDRGQIVSLGLLGSSPRVTAFRVDAGVTRLMVTAEDEGGSPQPHPPVLIQGDRTV